MYLEHTEIPSFCNLELNQMTDLNLNIGNNNDRNNAAVGRSAPKAETSAQPETYPSSNQENKRANMSSSTPVYNPFAGLKATNLFGQEVNASTGSEGFNAMIETMRKTLKANKVDDRFDVIGFPKEVHTNLHFSVIAIVRNNKVPLDETLPLHQFVTAQALLIESTGESLRPYTVEENRRTFTHTPTSEDVYNRLMTDYLREQLSSIYNGSNIYLIDPVIVRRTFKMDNEDAVKAQLVESQIAVETRSHIRVPGFMDFNYVSNLGSKDLQLPVSVNITGGETRYDTQGLPIYIDATVDVAIERVGSRNSRVYVPNSPDESKRMCQVGVMVELVPVDPELLDENRSRSRKNRDFTPEVAWAPRAVVTAIEQYLTRTPSGIFFAAASVAELGQDRIWAQTFRPTKNTDQQNLRDIGFLNIEANLDYENNDSHFGQPIDTSAGRFSDRDMALLLDNTVTRYPMIAVDCMTTGSQAYYTTMLYNIARASTDAGKKSRLELIQSLRDATNGLIDDYIDLNKVDLLEDAGELLHTGYWFDNAGKMRDIREIDNYLAIACCAGTNNPEMIQQWSDTWLRTDISEAQRMSERLTFIQSAASGTVTVTGTALRVTLNAEVVSAFVRALEAGGLPLISRDTGRGDQFQTHRSISRVRESTLYRGNGFGGRDTRREGGRYSNSYAASRY